MLEIENLRKHFGTQQVLRGLNLEVKDNEIYGFVGPNGAGKTTTIRIICGMLKADTGTVRLDGAKIEDLGEKIRLSVGFVPDFFGVYDNLTVEEYINFFTAAYGFYGKKAEAKSREILDLVRMSDKADMFVDELSRGMKQRICVGRALIPEPKLLVMDEPSGGLDPKSRKEFYDLIRTLKICGHTILISSHILSELAELSTYIGIINEGKIVLQDKVDNIMMKIDEQNPIQITVLSRVQETVQILKKNPLVDKVSIEDNCFVVWFNGSMEEEGLLLRELVSSGVVVTSFVREQRPLESLFFHLTEEHETGENT